MAQGEFARPQDLGLDDGEIAPLRTGAAGSLSAAPPRPGCGSAPGWPKMATAYSAGSASTIRRST